VSSRPSFSELDSIFATLAAGQSAATEPADMPPRPRVLVVEDDPVIAHLIDHLLTRKGFEVEVVTDGHRAQTIVETAAPPCVLLLDVMLPFVGGFELIDHVRRRAEWAKVPILMLTAKSHESYVVRAFGAGADDYVTKPFRPEELVARVRRLAGA
jgi:two-component system alkaline phosphatase synthesis response regulator PhoP